MAQIRLGRAFFCNSARSAWAPNGASAVHGLLLHAFDFGHVGANIDDVEGGSRIARPADRVQGQVRPDLTGMVLDREVDP
jgi:hypothetical protein